MTTVTYNAMTNRLTISDNGKPIRGIIGPMASREWERILQKQLAHYQKNAEELSKWLYNPKNINSPKWSENKRLYNATQVRITTIREKLNPTRERVGTVQNEIRIPQIKPSL